jgi:Integrase zinc binding domain/Integrase core domain
VETQQLLLSSSLKLSSLPVRENLLWGDVSIGTFRPLVPEQWRKKIFQAMHNISHPGRLASKRLISSRFEWPRISKDVQQWVAECMACQRSKSSSHTALAPASIPVPAKRFTHIHIDLVGPLPVVKGLTHLLTIIDRSTRWPEAIPLSSTTAESCAEALQEHWISRFGVPSLLTSDRGPQFSGAVCAHLCSLLGIKHQMTSAFHPQSNGMVERMHHQLKEALRARLSSSNWLQQLPWALLGIRVTPRGQHEISPAEAVYGEQILLPNEWLDRPAASEADLASIAAKMSSFSPAAPVHHARSVRPDASHLPEALMAAKFVWVRVDRQQSSLAARYEGPFLVLKRSPKVFVLQRGHEQVTVSTMRLKPATVAPDFQPQRPAQEEGLFCGWLLDLEAESGGTPVV